MGGFPVVCSTVTRSEEHTSELQYLVISYAVFCLKNVPFETSHARAGKRGRAFDVHGLHRVVRLGGWQRSRIFSFFNDPATTEIYTLSLHDALPISMHMHNVRHMWLVAAAKGKPLPDKLDRATVTKLRRRPCRRSPKVRSAARSFWPNRSTTPKAK